MAHKFITSTIQGKKWNTGVCWFFEFTENNICYLAVSLTDKFESAISVEVIKGKELQQLRELEDLIIQY